MPAQLERLKQDIVELEAYIKKLEKRGNTTLIPKIKRKRDYLENHIAEKLQLMQQEAKGRLASWPADI